MSKLQGSLWGMTLAGLTSLWAVAPAMAGFVRIEGTGFSLQLGDRPVPARRFTPKYIHPYPHYKYYHPHYYYNYYYSQPVTPSITITPQGTTIILPSTIIERSSQSFYYYYGF